MSVRQKALNNEEDCLHDARFSKIRFLHALETGIRNGNVRNDLHLLLKNRTTTDEELLQCVTFAVSNESEQPEKLSNKKKSDTSISLLTSNNKRTILSICKLRSSNWTTVSNYKPFVLKWKYTKKLCTEQLKLTYMHNLLNLKLLWIMLHPGSLFSKTNDWS